MSFSSSGFAGSKTVDIYSMPCVCVSVCVCVHCLLCISVHAESLFSLLCLSSLRFISGWFPLFLWFVSFVFHLPQIEVPLTRCTLSPYNIIIILVIAHHLLLLLLYASLDFMSGL
ncbi:hypothetical protein HDV57DRAFT_241590 [Trichoderma longibrachiatum]